MHKKHLKIMETLLGKTINICGICCIIFGILALILNNYFSIFSNVAFTNWLIAFAIGLFYCITSICSNFLEYHVGYPKRYFIWELFYPLFFLGSILALLYLNFVAIQNSLILNIIAGSILILTFLVEIRMDARYEDD